VQPDSSDIDADSATLAGPKVRLQTLSALDGRTVAAKRTFELIEVFLKDLGGRASAGDMLSIRNAAMLVALLEDMASRQLSGEVTDVDQLVRLSNAARRAVAALNLPKSKRQPTGSDALKEHIAKRRAERASAAAEGEL
jgi:hypothetical protein